MQSDLYYMTLLSGNRVGLWSRLSVGKQNPQPVAKAVVRKYLHYF